MRLSGRPLLATATDQALLVGRDDQLAAVDRAVDGGLSVLVHGARGCGRTSLLRAVQHRRRDDRDLGVGYVRAAGLADPVQVLAAVLAALAPEPAGPPASGGDVTVLLAALAERSAEQRRLVLLDDVSPAVGNLVFGVLRDELWETKTQWVVTALDDELATLLRPPADAFFEVRVALPPLGAADARELLRRRLPGAADELVTALAGDGGQPRRLLDDARQLAATTRLDGSGTTAAAGAADELLAARREWDERLAALGRPAEMVAAELAQLGPVSASDAVLLDRLGWTRPRAVQVLTALERAGLVESGSAVAAGPGRPKKIFRLLSPAEARQRRPAGSARPAAGLAQGPAAGSVR